MNAPPKRLRGENRIFAEAKRDLEILERAERGEEPGAIAATMSLSERVVLAVVRDGSEAEDKVVPSLEERLRARIAEPCPPRAPSADPEREIALRVEQERERRAEERARSAAEDSGISQLWHEGGTTRSIAEALDLPVARVGRRLLALGLRRDKGEGVALAFGLTEQAERKRRKQLEREGRASSQGVDARKPSLLLEASVVEEMRAEAARLDRSVSWLAQKAWQIARDRIRAQPAAFVPAPVPTTKPVPPPPPQRSAPPPPLPVEHAMVPCTRCGASREVIRGIVSPCPGLRCGGATP